MILLNETVGQEIEPIASQIVPQIAITTSPTNIALPGLTINGIPAGRGVSQAMAILNARTVDNTASFSNAVGAGTNLTGRANVNSVYNLLDPSASFTPGALVGFTIMNLTDGSFGIITINTTTTCTVGGGLHGGKNNTWTLNDVYYISSQNFQGQKSVGGLWVPAYVFNGGEFATPSSTIGAPGPVIIGNYNITSQVPGNGLAMSFQWVNAFAVQNNLNLNDIQIVLRIWVA